MGIKHTAESFVLSEGNNVITILKLYGGKIGGTEKACSTLYQMLSALYPKKVKVAYAIEFNECPINDYEFHLGLSPCLKVLFYIRYLLSVLCLVNKNKIIICTDLATSSIVSIAKIITKSKVQIIAWEHFPYEKNGKLIAFIFEKFKLHKQIRKFVFNNSVERDKLNYISDKSKLEVIPNAIVFPDRFVTQENLGTDIIRLLYVGRVSEEKGVDRLIKSVIDFQERTPSCHVSLTIVGGGEILSILQREYSTNQNIIFAGFQSDVEKYYLQSDVFVSGSRFECFPISVLEALSYSIPVLSMDDSGGTASILKQGEFGFIVNSVFEFYNKLHELCNQTLRCRLGSNGREFVKANFTHQIVSEKWRKLVE